MRQPSRVEVAKGRDHYLYYNGHGDLAAEADGSGTRTALHTYDPFGAPNETPPADSTANRFTGAWDKQTDSTSGLVLMGARPYDPRLGRFLAVDPIDGGSLNNYDYAAQDPINRYDLDGLAALAIPSEGGGSLGGGIGIGILVGCLFLCPGSPVNYVNFGDDPSNIISLSTKDPLSFDNAKNLGKSRGGKKEHIRDAPGGEEAAEDVIDDLAKSPDATKHDLGNGRVQVRWKDGRTATLYPSSSENGTPTIQFNDRGNITKTRFH